MDVNQHAVLLLLLHLLLLLFFVAFVTDYVTGASAYGCADESAFSRPAARQCADARSYS
jgi:hypothetical protein